MSSFTGLARVNDPGDSNYYPYDIGRANDMEYFNRNRIREVSLKDAIGYELAKSYGVGLEKGTKVTQEIVKELKRRKYKTVKIKKKKIKYQHVLKPARYVPLYSNDWISRLDHKYLKNTLEMAAASGEEASIHGPDPVPAFAYGAEFGKTDDPTKY